MIEITQKVFILSEREYKELKDPDKRYAMITESMADKAVKNILEFHEYKCWNDTGEDYDDGCCSVCPVLQVLGRPAGERMCTRQKRWSK